MRTRALIATTLAALAHTGVASAEAGWVDHRPGPFIEEQAHSLLIPVQQRRDPFREAQEQNERFQQEQAAREQQRKAETLPTTGAAMPYPLSQLLTAGWEITSTYAPGLLIIRQGKRWGVCELNLLNGLGHLQDQPTSRCYSLN